MCAVKNLIAIKASSRVLNNEATTRNSLLTRFVFFSSFLKKLLVSSFLYICVESNKSYLTNIKEKYKIIAGKCFSFKKKKCVPLQMLLSITFLSWQIILVSTSYRYISEEMSIDIFATANCYYKFPPPKLICELNRWKREELNNKQIDTFQSSGASFDEQFICDTHQRWTKEWISVEEF